MSLYAADQNFPPLIKGPYDDTSGLVYLSLAKRASIMKDNLYVGDTVCLATPEVAQLALDFLGSRLIRLGQEFTLETPSSHRLKALLNRRDEEFVSNASFL
jgi:hypothetical protein